MVRFGGVFQPKRKPEAQGEQNRILHCDENLSELCTPYKAETNSKMATVLRTALYYLEKWPEFIPDPATEATPASELKRYPFGSSVNTTSSARVSARIRLAFVIS
jgi:hypothetical protein